MVITLSVCLKSRDCHMSLKFFHNGQFSLTNWTSSLAKTGQKSCSFLWPLRFEFLARNFSFTVCEKKGAMADVLWGTTGLRFLSAAHKPGIQRTQTHRLRLARRRFRSCQRAARNEGSPRNWHLPRRLPCQALLCCSPGSVPSQTACGWFDWKSIWFSEL